MDGPINWPSRSPDLIHLDYGLWVWIKSQVYERKVNTRDALLTSILDAAARIRERRDQVRQTTYDIHMRAAKCTEVEGGMFENLLQIDDVWTHYKFGTNLFPFMFNFQNANVHYFKVLFQYQYLRKEFRIGHMPILHFYS
jgi:hypothetical protein